VYLEQKGKLLRQSIINMLDANVCTVVFTKKDLTERRLLCTRMPEHVSGTLKGTGQPKPENLEVVPVYDLEAKHWKSFRLDSYKSIASESYP